MDIDWRISSYKRLTIRRCGGTLTDAEDAEEAELTARVAAFRQTPEGRGRRRIFELELPRHHREGLSPAEQVELETLRGLYPELPPDPDDPFKYEVKPWERERPKRT